MRLKQDSTSGWPIRLKPDSTVRGCRAVVESGFSRTLITAGILAIVRFDPEYVSHVLNENFEDAKALFLSPLMAIHYAHLVMLADRGIVSPADAHALRDALDSISVPDVRATPFDRRCEDLFFHVEQLVVQACGEETAGRLHTARSRNDIDMTMYRLRQREFIL